jgi:hypothetical protein
MVLSRSNGPQNVHEGRGGPPDVGLSESHMYSTPHGGEGHHQRPNGLQGPHYSDRGSRMRSGSSERRPPPNQKEAERAYGRNAPAPHQDPSSSLAGDLGPAVDMMTVKLPAANLEEDLDSFEKLLWEMREKQLIFEMSQRRADVSEATRCE